MEIEYQVQYIEPSSDEIQHIRKIIKDQGNKTCNSKINTVAINAYVTSFNFGWISLTPKAQLGRRSIKNFSDKFLLRAFLLCVCNPSTPTVLQIDIVCSEVKTGKFLMSLAEDKARSMGLKRIILYALPDQKLLNWYKSIGFEPIIQINDSRSKNDKLFYMEKLI